MTSTLNKRLRKAGLFALVCLVFAAAGLPACAPRSASEAGGTNGAGASSASMESGDFTWSVDSDCSTCHDHEASSMTDASCQISQHHQNLECISCHNEQEALAKAHEKVTLPVKRQATRLKTTEVSREVCLGCHEAPAVPEESYLIDANGTAVDPHNLPQTPDGSHNDIACANCHTMHDSASVADSALETCYGCHHAKVFQCGTCHE